MKQFEKETKVVCSDQIFVDETYQRRIARNELNNILKHFDPNIVNMPKLSFRDGKYWVYDGQHTVTALVARNNNNPVKIECIVHYGMTQLDEAYYFKMQTGYSSKPSATDKLRGDYNMGDAAVKQMVRAIDATGLEIKFDGCAGQNKIICSATIWKSFNALELSQFIDMLSVIKSAWNGTPDSLCNQIISGMTRFYKTYNGNFNSKSLAEKLRKDGDPIAIVREAKGIGGGNATIARIILRIYNKGRTEAGRLEDKL